MREVQGRPHVEHLVDLACHEIEQGKTELALWNLGHALHVALTEDQDVDTELAKDLMRRIVRASELVAV